LLELKLKLDEAADALEWLYWEIIFAQAGFWVDQFQQLEKQKDRMRDPTRAIRLLVSPPNFEQFYCR
jgi:hypothetical protein